MKEHTVYVKRRPYLQTFLEKVAEMFEIMIFTASQSTYAEKLLDILDPESKLISKRAYRESCLFSDGTYTKDLTVLGVDLAKVAIIDNSPQVISPHPFTKFLAIFIMMMAVVYLFVLLMAVHHSSLSVVLVEML